MRTHIQAARLAGLLLTATVPLGCAHAPPAPATPIIVGTWHGTTTTPQGATAQSTFTFTADGRETMAVQIRAAGRTLSLGSTGTYTLSGAQLTQTIATVTLNGRPAALPTQSPRSEADRYTLHGDTLTLTKSGSPLPLILTRQKS